MPTTGLTPTTLTTPPKVAILEPIIPAFGNHAQQVQGAALSMVNTSASPIDVDIVDFMAFMPAESGGYFAPDEKTQLADTVDELNNYIINTYTSGFTGAATAITDLTEQGYDVINISSGYRELWAIQDLQKLLSQKNSDNTWQYPLLRQTVLGDAWADTRTDTIAVQDYMAAILEGTTADEAAEAQFAQAVEAAYQNDVAVVTTTGNDRAVMSLFSSIDQEARFNRYLQVSSHVIGVAAHTPTQEVAHYSSQVTENTQASILTADGTVKGTQGTSFAAPRVAASLALLQAQNPALNMTQRLDILNQTATDSPTIAYEDEGAGQLNLEAALEAAEVAQN